MRPLVTIESYSRVIDARLAQARLEGAGIATFLLDESVASIDPFLINAIGGVKLQVGLDDEQAARELLAEPLPDRPDDVDPDAQRCPRCDSEYVFAEAGDNGRLTCRRCKFTGKSEAFAPKARSGSTSENQGKNAAPAPSPVFRLERRRGLVGAIVGFCAGFLLAVIVPNVAMLVIALGAVGGYAVGRNLRYWVCSEPSCRGPLRPDESSCDKCSRSVRGTVTSEEEHFVRVAEWRREHAETQVVREPVN
jgi:ribosomal protein S27AE